MNSLKLNKLSANKLSEESANAIKGGNGSCCCGCMWQFQGGSCIDANDAANRAGGLSSPNCVPIIGELRPYHRP